jgi:hypothetical protein
VAGGAVAVLGRFAAVDELGDGEAALRAQALRVRRSRTARVALAAKTERSTRAAARALRRQTTTARRRR